MPNTVRAVIYARYSSDNQREASIDDQVELCRRYIAEKGWGLTEVYSDRAISGASRHRPGYQQMLADAEQRSFDVVVSEALDRLGRKLSDVADLHDRLQFLGEIVEVPELRMISDELWMAVRARQEAMRHRMSAGASANALNRAHRAKFLLAGLLRCGVCGGGYTIVGVNRYGCATRRAKGTCDNTATVHRSELECRVLEGLKTRLMAPELVREFVAEFQREMNKMTAEREGHVKAVEQQLGGVERKIASLVSAIEDGGYSRALSERLAALEREREDLRAVLKTKPTREGVRLHPRLADVYAEKVSRLAEALNEETIRDEANELLRSLVNRIELRPRDGAKGVIATIHGDLARILTVCAAANGARKNSLIDADGRHMTSVVAGARYQRYLPGPSCSIPLVH